MPAKNVQERTWEATLTHLKPTWRQNGVEEDLNDGWLYNGYKNDRTKKMTKDGFFKNIPDRPYFVWTRPTQRPDPSTLNKSFAEQQAYYANLVAQQESLYDPTDLIPTEYSALQVIFTAQIQDEFKDRTGGTSKPTNIRPLDTYFITRFLSAGAFSDASIPKAFFYPDNRQMSFTYNFLQKAEATQGFRPASRS